ncbi:MAG: hypothetical protein JEZ03_12230 [Bacteroidales bacterium]|nr:hypothetical protein [Bacteroidales bacterium]
MECNVNKIDTNKDLADLKHKLVALDGIMQAGIKTKFLHDNDAPISDSNSDLKS